MLRIVLLVITLAMRFPAASVIIMVLLPVKPAMVTTSFTGFGPAVIIKLLHLLLSEISVA